MTTPDQGAQDQTFDKASRDALAALSIMYRECHASAPDSDLCGAIQDLQRAVAEVHNRKMSGDDQPPPATIADAASQMHAATMAGAQPQAPQEAM